MAEPTYIKDAAASADADGGSRRPTTQLRDYGVMLLNRWPIIAAALVVGLGLTWFVTQRQVRLYRTSALIRLTPPTRGVSRPGDMLAPSIASDPVELTTLLELVQMSETVEKAVLHADLAGQPDFAGLTNAEIVKLARGRISASRRRGQYLVDVSATGPDPKILDDLANAVVNYFADEQRDRAEMARSQRKADLNGRLGQVNQKRETADIDKRALLKDAGFTEAAFDEHLAGLMSTREALRQSRTSVSVRQMDQEATYGLFKSAVDGNNIDSVRQNAFVRDNPDIRALRSRVDRAGTKLYELTDVKGKGPADPDVLTVKRELEQAKGELAATERALVVDFVASYGSDEEKMSRLKDLAAANDKEIAAANEIGYRLSEINADIARYERDRQDLKAELELLGPDDPMIAGSVQVVGLARERDVPFSPNVPLNYTLGTILALLVGIAIAFLVEYLDDTIRTKDELAKVTAVPLLGVIPYIRGSRSDAAGKDLVAYKYPKDTVAEAYRGVRTALTLSSRGSDLRVLLFTSAGPREGKTTTVINVATVFSYSGARTVVVDGDLRKPRVHASFGLKNIEGLSNALATDADPVALCQRTEVPGVDILTSGPIPPNPSELLGSPRMRRLLERLCEKYDHVLIDTPPIGAVTDAAVLGTLVDGVILVVHAGKTRRGIVNRGIEQLRYIHAPIEGVILNNLRTGRRGYYAGYYNYYYYYSYYGSGSARDTTGEEAAGSDPRGLASAKSVAAAKD